MSRNLECDRCRSAEFVRTVACERVKDCPMVGRPHVHLICGRCGSHWVNCMAPEAKEAPLAAAPPEPPKDGPPPEVGLAQGLEMLYRAKAAMNEGDMGPAYTLLERTPWVGKDGITGLEATVEQNPARTVVGLLARVNLLGAICDGQSALLQILSRGISLLLERTEISTVVPESETEPPAPLAPPAPEKRKRGRPRKQQEEATEPAPVEA